MGRGLNILFGLLLFLPLAPVMLAIGLLVRLTSPGPAIHWSTRMGKDSTRFKMPKFRTMRIDTPDVATHLLTDSSQYITSIGKFLRKTSLDELPQLYSVLKGDMAFVGPRPALHNQDDLMDLRRKAGVDCLTPGITGWAQVLGRDELPVPKKVELETYYLNNRSLMFDFKILFLTVSAVIKSKGVSH